MPDPEQSSAAKTVLWTLGAILPWASMAAVIEYGLHTLPSSQLLFWSFLFAAPAAIFWDWWLGGRSVKHLFKVRGIVIAIGLLGIFGWSAGLILSLDRAPVIEANLLTYLWPLMMVALAPLAGERFSRLSLIGAVIGFAGAVLIVSGGQAVSIKPSAMLGYSLAFGGALAWALFVILLQRQGRSAMRRTPVFVLGSLICSVAVALVMDGEISIPPVPALLAAVWLGVAPLSLAFVCWDRAVSGPYLGLVGRLSFFDALLSTMFLALFLREWPTGAVWIGMALISFGVTMPELFMLRQSRTESSVSQSRDRQ